MNTTMIYTLPDAQVLTISLISRESLVKTVLKEKDYEFIAIIPTQLNLRVRE